jgi:hypothetical protein
VFSLLLSFNGFANAELDNNGTDLASEGAVLHLAGKTFAINVVGADVADARADSAASVARFAVGAVADDTTTINEGVTPSNT